MGLDPVVGEQADDRRRQEGQQDEEDEALRRTGPHAVGREPQQRGAEFPGERHDGTELDEDLEGRIAEIQQARRDDEVPGGGHGHELGEPLDDAEHGRFEELDHRWARGDGIRMWCGGL